MNYAGQGLVPRVLLREVRHMVRHSQDRSLDRCVLKLDLKTLNFLEVEGDEKHKETRGRNWRRKHKKLKAKKPKPQKQGKKKKKYHRPSICYRTETYHPVVYR